MGHLPLPPGSKGHHSEVSGRLDVLRIRIFPEAEFLALAEKLPTRTPSTRIPRAERCPSVTSTGDRRGARTPRRSRGRPNRAKFIKNKNGNHEARQGRPAHLPGRPEAEKGGRRTQFQDLAARGSA